jgi:DNA-binding CsgD family transcriptional regulator
VNTASPAPNDPRMARLTEAIEESRLAIAEFRSAMRFVNDQELQAAAMPVIEAAELVFKQHSTHLSPTIANDTANLLAAFNQLDLPGKDVDLGPLPGLKALRGARGNVREEFSQILGAARAFGWQPSEPALPDIGGTEVSNAGLEGMLKALIARMEAVEQVLDRAVAPEGEAAPDRTPIQIVLVNAFVRNLRVELALAKLEARLKNLVDLSALGRAIENVAELTADFAATVRGIAAKMTMALRDASEQLRPRVRKVAGGFKTIVRKVASIARRKRGEDLLAPPDIPVELPTQAPEPRPEFDLIAALEGGDAARLEEAVNIYRTALREQTRDRVPLEWAMTQNFLGIALRALGERESGTAHLEQAVEAYRAALQERTRERVPLEWAWTQYNLGNALATLGQRESGTAHLEQAVDAYRTALQECTHERAPYLHDRAQGNLSIALERLEQRSKRHDDEKAESTLQYQFDSLTEREREVLALVASGLLNKQIAQQLQVNERTVKVHRTHLMKKMKARSIAELVIMAQTLGIKRENQA